VLTGHVPRGVCADGDGLSAGCREANAASVSSRLAVLAVRTGAGAVGPAARAVRAGCVRRGPGDCDDRWADGGGGRRRAGACRWRCRAGRGRVRWRVCVVRECARGGVGGAVLRVSGSQVYAAHGLVFDIGVEANASAVVVNDNAGALTDGALLVVRGSASFVSGSWLSVRGNSISGRLLSVPPYPRSADFAQSTLTLHRNAGSGPVVMDGTVALGGAGGSFVVGCLTLNGQALQPIDYR
ncbi:dispersed gene family protein 1 (DGF-1), putative, partial [Trypanosoma cruzi marinkellei]